MDRMIELQEQLPVAYRERGDNWRGLTSAEERRRIQNRLHQRTWRMFFFLITPNLRGNTDVEAGSLGSRTRAARQEAVLQSVKDECGRDDLHGDGEVEFGGGRGLILVKSSGGARCQDAKLSPWSSVSGGESLTTLSTRAPDPLLVLQPLLSNPKLRGVWKYGVNILWPGSASKPPDHHDPHSWTWSLFRAGTATPLLFHALSWAMSAGVDLYRVHSDEHEAMGLWHQNKAIGLLKQTLEIQRAREEEGLADETILAIGLLMQGRELPDFEAANRSGTLYGAFRPLLRHLQWLSCVGGTEKVRVHKVMLRRAVDARGGLANVREVVGLGEWLQYHDIADASHHLTRPYFGLCVSYQACLDGEMVRCREMCRSKDCPQFAFEGLGLDGRLLEVLWDMRSYIELTEHYCASGGSKPQVDLPQLAVHRNLIQFRLLSLKQGEIGGTDELVWLGAMIFSYAVIYPLPDRRPLDTLLGRLKGALITVGTLAVRRELLLWLNMVGAMAMGGRAGGRWFASNLKDMSRTLNLHGWLDVRAAVHKYLWSDEAGEVGGERIWGLLGGLE